MKQRMALERARVIGIASSAPDDGFVGINFGPSTNDPCAADLTPTTRSFMVPERVNSIGLTIEASYEAAPEVHRLTLE